MANKITISQDILDEFAPKETIQNISLSFSLSNEYKTVNLDLSSLNNNSLQRRKDLKQFKDFLINSSKSINTKITLYEAFQRFIKNVGDDFSSEGDLNKIIKKYSSTYLERVNKKEISAVTYTSIRSKYRTIFNECYGMNNNDFLMVFPEYSKRTGMLKNATILDYKGEEKSFTKEEFKDISRIFLNLSYLFEQKIKEIENNELFNEKETHLKYQDIYDLTLYFYRTNISILKNRNTFCLMIVFTCLTGINMSPMLKMKRSDFTIDYERNVVSFSATCLRKKKEQVHNYPLKANQLKFFERVITNSRDIASENDILFPIIKEDLSISYFPEKLKNYYRFFNAGFIGKYKELNLNLKKLRNSFGNQFDDIDLRSVALFNSTTTAAKNYSAGNSEENNQQLQNAMNIYTLALSNKEDIGVVKENIAKINVINIKDIQTLKQENSQITSNGIFCLNSKKGNESEKFTRRIEKLNLENIDSINCSNLLACFNCKNSILVNDFENIYLLKSFYDYLNSSIYDSDTSNLFSDENAVKNALISIKMILDNKLDKKIINKVNKHIEKHGIHPVWNLE